MSDAEVNLALLQKEHPGKGRKQGMPVDWVKDFYSKLEPNLPDWTKKLSAAGQLVVGEVGVDSPDAYTEHFQDGSHAVVITSGDLDFFRAVAIEVAASLTLLPDLTPAKPSQSIAEAVIGIGALLTQFYNKSVFKGRALDSFSQPLSEMQLVWAQDIADTAGLFILAHELGHVAQKVNPRLLGESEEQDADRFAFTLMLAMSNRIRLELTYAGAIFACRVHSALEFAGFKFTDSNAPPSKRLAWLKNSIRMDATRHHVNLQVIAWLEVSFDQVFDSVQELVRPLNHSRPDGSTGLNQLSSGKSLKPNAITPSTSKAAAALRDLQHANPPWEIDNHGKPLDRAKWYCPILSRLIPQLAEDLASGKIAIGEVGLTEPASTSQLFDDDTRLIALNSGLLGTIYAASLFLHGQVGILLSTGEIAGAISRYDVTICTLVTFFRELPQRGFSAHTFAFALPAIWQSSTRIIDPQMEFLDVKQQSLAHDLAIGAVVFILASKIQEWSIPERPDNPLNFNEGMTAYFFSLSVALLGFRQSYPSALFAVRVLNCIECCQTGLTPTNPNRTLPINSAPWKAAGSEAAHKYVVDTAKGYDQMMELVEMALWDPSVEIPADPGPVAILEKEREDDLWARDCVAWWLTGGIYQWATVGDETGENVLKKMILVTEPMSDELVRVTAEAMFDRIHLKAKVKTAGDRDDVLKKSDAFDWLVENLPERARAIFTKVVNEKRSVLEENL